jgi:hypothetical protein
MRNDTRPRMHVLIVNCSHEYHRQDTGIVATAAVSSSSSGKVLDRLKRAAFPD